MNTSRHLVARGLGKRIAPLFVLLALLTFLGDPRAGGVQAGLFIAAGAALYAIVFGTPRAVTAFAPALLRSLAVWGVCLVAGAGAFASAGRAFGFITVAVGRMPVSIGGALTHLGVLVAIGSIATLIFLCIAARATPRESAK